MFLKIFLIVNAIASFDSSQWNVKNYTIREGLNSNRVYVITQDHNGRYWVASNAGLAYFDGYDFKYLTGENGIKNVDIINAIYNSQYLYTVSINKIEAINIKKLTKNYDSKLYPYNALKNFGDCNLNNKFYQLYKDSVIIFNGLNKKSYYLKYPYYSEKFHQIKSLIQTDENYNQDTIINIIGRYDKYYPFFLKNYWVYKLNTKEKLTKHVHLKRLIAAPLYLDSFLFFFRNLDMKLTMYNHNTKQYTNFLPQFEILGLKIHDNKGFWATTYKDGILLYTLKQYQTKTKQNFSFENLKNSKSILNDNRFLNDNIVSKNKEKLSFQYKGKTIVYPVGVKSFLKRNDNQFLIGRRNGTYCYTLGSKDTMGQCIDSSWVSKLKYTNNKIHILTYDNFKILNKNTKLIYRIFFKGQYVLIKDLEFNRNNYFIGTNDLGVFIGDTHFKIKYHLTEKDGLQSKLIQSIKSDIYGNNWVLSDKGIDKIDTQRVVTKIFSFSEINDYDINDFNITKDSLYLFSEDNIYSINYTERFKEENIPIVLNTIMVDDSLEFYEADAFIKIGPKWGTIKVNFSGIYPHQQNDIQYQYRIVRNKDTGAWQYTNQHILILTALKDGHYTIQVKAFHKIYPNIHSKVLNIRFHIIPYFYQTWWFYALIGIISLSLMFGFLWYRNKLRLDKLKAESELHRLTLSGLQNQMNPHFVFNALNTLQHFIVKNDYLNSLNFLSDFSTLIRKMLDNSRSEMINLEEEIHFLKQYVHIESERYSFKFKTEFKLDIDEDELSDIKIPPMLIQPLIENAIKHGVSNMEYGGMVNIEFVLLEEDLLQVSVIDNGKGLSLDKKSSSKATTILNERLMLINNKRHKGGFKLFRKDGLTYSTLRIPI